jgi:RNA polymerase sigma-70 factor (ECF subfamily)
LKEIRPNSLDQNTDEQLIALFQQGNSDAFDLIVKRFKDSLTNYTFRYLGDYDECDDVVQETFVRVYKNKDSYKPLAKFSTWIYTIATNLAKTRLRQKQKVNIFSFLKSKELEDRFEVIDTAYSLDNITDSILLDKIIQNALDKIPAKYKEAVILRDIQELSYEEISEIIKANVGTVKSRINRGRERLREILGKDIRKENNVNKKYK